MIFNTTSMKIMKYFFNKPYEKIHLRELSRRTNTSIYSTKKIVDDLVKQEIILEKWQGNQRNIMPNLENIFLRQLKIAFSIKKIQESGILPYLEEKIPAISSIVLYGSTAQGTDSEKSDIDLLVIGQKNKTDLSKFEQIIGKEINIIIMKWSEWRIHVKKDRAFYREILKDGIALLGDIPVIE
jgi:predicted nucleotidyltransferase